VRGTTPSTLGAVFDVYVGYLRRKLDKPRLSPLLVTVQGAGHRFGDESAAEPGVPDGTLA